MADNEKKVAEVDSKSSAAAEKKVAKAKKKGRVKNAWKGFKSELKKIVWPSWKQVLKNSSVVLVIVLICAVAIGALDFAFSKGFLALTEIKNLFG